MLKDAPELPNVVETNFVRPYAEHAPERDKHRDDVRDDEHLLRANLPVPLDVPEAKRATGTVSSRFRKGRASLGCVPGSGGNGLGEPEIGVVQERERELIVLADRDERACSVQPLQLSVSAEKADRGMGSSHRQGGRKQRGR